MSKVPRIGSLSSVTLHPSLGADTTVIVLNGNRAITQGGSASPLGRIGEDRGVPDADHSLATEISVPSECSVFKNRDPSLNAMIAGSCPWSAGT